MAKVAINGLGRIGRATLKIVMNTPGWTWSPPTISELRTISCTC